MTMLMPPNSAKYLPPRLPAVVSRQRLLKRLQAHADRPMILLVGQAAQGKSTLVMHHLHNNKIAGAWLHLDARDGDCANFYHLLVCALAKAFPDKSLEKYRDQDHVALGISAASVRFEALLSAIWQRLPTDINIVLHGLEQLPKGAPAYGLIQQMISLCEQKGRLIILSRQMPPFKLQQWVMRRQVLIMDNDELAFSRDEIKAFFEAVHDLKLTNDNAANILDVTGGWAGGLVLVSQVLSRKPPSQWPNFLASELPDRLTSEALRYFSEEIFDAQPQSVQDFLIKASILEVMDPSTLSALLDQNNSTGILEDLVRRNLFVQSVYDKHQQPCYRLNQLFHGFLKTLFQKRLDPATQRRLYIRAGEIYRSKRRNEVAVGYFLKAEAFDAASESIKKIGLDFVIRGRFVDLSASLKAFPAEQVETDPWLFFLLTLTRRVKGGVRSIEDFQSVMGTFDARKDVRGQMLALAYLIEAQVFAGHDPSACQRWISQGEALLAAHGEAPYFAYARGLLWLQVGFGYIASGLDLTKGISACQNAYLMAHKMNDPRLMANANIVAVLGLASAGEFDRADEALAKIAAFADTDAYTEYHTLRSLVNVELTLRRGDLASAEKQLKQIASDIETFGLIFLYPAYIDAMGFLQIYKGEFKAARSTCRHLIDVATLSGNTYYEGLSHRLSALRHYFQGRLHDAVSAARMALSVLPRGERPTLHWMRTQQLMGLLQLHLNNYSQAEKRLHQALSYFSRTANFLSHCETHLALALLAHARDNMDTAIKHLTRGFALAAERQYDHFVLLCPEDLHKICRLAVACLDKSAAAWPEHLLNANFPKIPETAGAHPDPSRAAVLDDRRQAVKTHRSSSLEGILDIQTFGGFRVLGDDQIPIGHKQWGGNRPKLLLKAIVVHGVREIPKDILIDDLWPESHPDAAQQNFKVTLHRLRKILEPDLDKRRGSAYVHLKDNLISLDKNLCRVDVQDFLECCKDIKRASLSGEAQTILDLGRKVMELYQGDFLPEDPYAPWAEMKRLALKDEYIATLMLMAEIYDQQDQLEATVQCCRTVIATDACIELASNKLMQVYARQGRRNDAVKVYDQLRSALESDMGVAPDPAITGLYQRIREGSAV